MTAAMILLLVILVIALLLFSFEWVPPDVTSLGVLLALIIFRLVPLDRAFDGFGSDTFMLLFGLLIMTAALMRTGVMEIVGQRLLTLVHRYPKNLSLITMLAVGMLSSVINNTAAAAFFLPVLLGLSSRLKVSPSKILMPMAFAAILASSVTLIATSTNIVVSGLITQFGLSPIGMFELTPVGLPILAAGIVYMWLGGQRLIPDRRIPQELTTSFEMRSYMAELRILRGSPLAGKTLAETNLGRILDMTVVTIVRQDARRVMPTGDTLLEEGDALLVEASYESILKAKNIEGIAIQADAKFSDADLQGDGTRLFEVVLLPRSIFIGRTIRGLQLRERYQIQVLAVNRYSGIVHSKIADTRLSMGDVLLLQAKQEQIAALQRENVFNVLGVLDHRSFNVRRAWTILAIFGGVMVAGISGILPLPVAMLTGALLSFVTRCITPEEAYRRIEWRVLILIACMLALGVAMQTTGTAAYLANLLAAWVGHANPIWLLTGFFALTVLLTQPMSNQAAAAVVIPLALQTAVQLNLNPRAFAMMIAIAASTSYLTPLEPACLMIYGPGHYRFIDFVKVGGLLTLIVYLIAIGLVPLLWPL